VEKLENLRIEANHLQEQSDFNGLSLQHFSLANQALMPKSPSPRWQQEGPCKSSKSRGQLRVLHYGGCGVDGGCLISDGKPSFQPVLPQSTYPYSPRFEAQEAAITNFMPATIRVVFDLGAAPNSPEFHGPGPQTAARRVDGNCHCQTAGLQQGQ
jgi:hypothetical protein